MIIYIRQELSVVLRQSLWNQSNILTHGVSSVWSLRLPWRNPPRKSRLCSSTFPGTWKTSRSVLRRVDTQPISPYFLKLSQLQKAFRVCAHVLMAQRNFPDPSPMMPSSPKLEVKRLALWGGLRPTETLPRKISALNKKPFAEDAKVKRRSGPERCAGRCRIADGGGRPHAQTSSGAAGTQRMRSHAAVLGHCRGLLCSALMSRFVCARPAAWGTCARTRGRTKRSEGERIKCGV